MHFSILLAAVGLAYLLRLRAVRTSGSYLERWQRALAQFLFSPLLLLMTAVAIVCMGTQGQMVWWWEGWFCYLLALFFFGFIGVLGWQLATEARRSLRQVRSYPQKAVLGQPTRILDTPLPFSAQIGFWQPELVVSQGLIDSLDPEHLQAVLIHEQGHLHYRDTFWFIWLGWMRRFSAWLPHTETLWQELLLLREIRADGWAAQQVDALVLAESLLFAVRAPLEYSESFSAAFSCTAPRSRLEERIDALLVETNLVDLNVSPKMSLWWFKWLLVTLLPLIIIPFHY